MREEVPFRPRAALPQPLVSVAVAEGALEHTYYATLGSYPRGRDRITTAEDNCGREPTSAA